MRQSLANLVHNALRYAETGGLLLGVRRCGAAWQIEVWDVGVGIASDDSEHIFLLFFNIELAWQADSAGHGLGLAVLGGGIVLQAILRPAAAFGRKWYWCFARIDDLLPWRQRGHDQRRIHLTGTARGRRGGLHRSAQTG